MCKYFFVVLFAASDFIKPCSQCPENSVCNSLNVCECWSSFMTDANGNCVGKLFYCTSVALSTHLKCLFFQLMRLKLIFVMVVIVNKQIWELSVHVSKNRCLTLLDVLNKSTLYCPSTFRFIWQANVIWSTNTLD